ncbi:MAG TPA: putative zinc-binding protein [Methanoregulaceae archaeon]|nr:putative zinc-binding protein [Methanoregulaceae archaeon]HQJ88381.1 putative zinc-binding protein [Methanoregulaceae archaeon]
MAGERPKQTVVYGCAGASNTGQLANAAAVRMTQRGTGRIGCLGGVGSGQKGFVTAARLADEVVAIDGCEVGCVKKTLEAAGVAPNRHVVVTDLGIEKSGDLTLRDEEIDRVVRAAETASSTGTDPKQPPADSEGGCGCGCGTGGGSGCCG